MRNGFRMLLWIALTASLVSGARAGDPVYVGAKYKTANLISIDRVDHRAWNQLLAKYVDNQGMVDYRSWHASAADSQALQRYLQRLSQANPDQPAEPSAKMAFWINAYNAVTIHGILREYPTSSIRKHTAKLYGYNIWKDLQLVVGNRAYSLHYIEHDILRRTNEPRIHFAIVCASISCPKLRNEAYVGQTLEQQLADNTHDFFRNSRNFRFQRSNNTLYLSSIMKWYKEDFGADQRAQLRTISPYLPTREAFDAARQGRARVAYLDYDWGLNEQRR